MFSVLLRLTCFILLLSGCVATSRELDLLSEKSDKQEVRQILGKSYELYYQSEDPNANITEVWDYRLFPYKDRYDHFKKSLDRDVGVIGSLGIALLYPPPDIGKETYRLYFQGDQLLKWEVLTSTPSEELPKTGSKTAEEAENE